MFTILTCVQTLRHRQRPHRGHCHVRDAGCNLTVTENARNRDEGSALPRSATPKVTAEQNRHSSAGHCSLRDGCVCHRRRGSTPQPQSTPVTWAGPSAPPPFLPVTASPPRPQQCPQQVRRRVGPRGQSPKPVKVSAFANNVLSDQRDVSREAWLFREADILLRQAPMTPSVHK